MTNNMTNNIPTDVMIDLETMGNSQSAAIVSISAVPFNMETGLTFDPFHVDINFEDCLKYLKADASTIMWWMQQSDEARNKLLESMDSRVNLHTALMHFGEALDKMHIQRIWANGASFDFGILRNAYDKIGQPLPWSHRKECCMRSYVNMHPSVKENWKRTGTDHVGVDDCLNQIGILRQTMVELGCLKPVEPSTEGVENTPAREVELKP